MTPIPVGSTIRHTFYDAVMVKRKDASDIRHPSEWQSVSGNYSVFISDFALRSKINAGSHLYSDLIEVSNGD